MALTRRAASLVATVATLVAGLTLAVLPVSPAEARPTRSAHASWNGLDVWHFRLKTFRGFTYPVSIEFRGNRLPYPVVGVTAIAATADTAIVQLNDFGQKFGLGRLVELPATGTAGRSLDRHPLGTVIADPDGHVAFWSSKRPDGAHLVALDTTTGTKTIGPAVRSRQRVFAVEGATAYVVDGLGRPDPTTLSWSPGQPALTELPAAFDHGGIISDVSGDRVLSLDLDDGLYLTDRAGTLLRTIPTFLGTFSPDAAHLVSQHHNFMALFETETGARVRLSGLDGRKPYSARWSPGGVLVVDAGPRHQDSDGDVVSYACTAADGACARLTGPFSIEALPFVPSNAFGQFLDYLPAD